jgi:hypothetical protein
MAFCIVEKVVVQTWFEGYSSMVASIFHIRLSFQEEAYPITLRNTVYFSLKVPSKLLAAPASYS